MTQKDFIKAYSVQNGTSLVEASNVIKNVFSLLSNVIKDERQISINGFGTFQLKFNNEKMSRNPRTGEQVKVPSKFVMKFKASKALNESFNS